jgi:hypothetical protein
LIASEAPYAVVLRRWPSKETTTFGWDLTTDTFTYGQWVKARIYPECSDLSPDGKHLLIYADGKRWGNPPYFGLSRAPYLKALGFYEPKGGNSSGCYWIDNKSFWMMHAPVTIRADHELVQVPAPKTYTHSWNFRLLRDGWIRLADPVFEQKPNSLPAQVGSFDDEALFFELFHQMIGKEVHWFTEREFVKMLPAGWVLIRVIRNNHGSHPSNNQFWDQFGLVNKDLKVSLIFHNWEWADNDAPRDRILYAEKGKIFAVKLTHEGLDEPTELFDSTQYGRDPVVAPY